MSEAAYAVREAIRQEIAGPAVELAEIEAGRDLYDDLGAKSLDVINVICVLQQRFDVELSHYFEARTVGDLIALLERAIDGGAAGQGALL